MEAAQQSDIKSVCSSSLLSIKPSQYRLWIWKGFISLSFSSASRFSQQQTCSVNVCTRVSSHLFTSRLQQRCEVQQQETADASQAACSRGKKHMLKRWKHETSIQTSNNIKLHNTCIHMITVLHSDLISLDDFVLRWKNVCFC